jgi:hypothetical protein
MNSDFRKKLMGFESNLVARIGRIPDSYLRGIILSWFCSSYLSPSKHDDVSYPRYANEEMIGTNYRRYVGEKRARQIYKDANSVYITGKPAKWFSWEFLTKSGETRFIEASSALRLNAHGEVIGFRGIFKDVTEHEAIEQQVLMTSKLASFGSVQRSLKIATKCQRPYCTKNPPIVQLWAASQTSTDLTRTINSTRRTRRIS